jgi:hypothetical protein
MNILQKKKMLKPQAQKSNHVEHEDGTGNTKKRKNKIKSKKTCENDRHTQKAVRRT